MGNIVWLTNLFIHVYPHYFISLRTWYKLSAFQSVTYTGTEWNRFHCKCLKRNSFDIGQKQLKTQSAKNINNKTTLVKTKQIWLYITFLTTQHGWWPVGRKTLTIWDFNLGHLAKLLLYQGSTELEKIHQQTKCLHNFPKRLLKALTKIFKNKFKYMAVLAAWF